MKIRNGAAPGNQTRGASPSTRHGEALSPGTLEAFGSELLDRVRGLNERLLQEHKALKPLLSIKDVAKTLGISPRTAETMLAAGELPPPLWIGKQRRWHPDSIAAYVRSREAA